jgi:hypothetical protein
LGADFFSGPDMKGTNHIHEAVQAEFHARRRCGFRDPVAVEHEKIAWIRLYDQAVIGDVSKQAERHTSRPFSLARPSRFELMSTRAAKHDTKAEEGGPRLSSLAGPDGSATPSLPLRRSARRQILPELPG